MIYWLWSVPPEHYPVYARTGTFAVRRVGKGPMQAIRPGDRIVAYLPGSRVIAGLFEATSEPFEDSTALVRGGHYPHRVRVRALAELNEEVRVPYEAFAGKLRVLDEYDFPDEDRQFRAVAQRVVHPLPQIDGKLLEFLIDTRRGTDFDTLVASLDRLRDERADERADEVIAVREEAGTYQTAPPDWDRADATERLISAIEKRGYVYEPWHVAAYVTTIRTKPFVILAGVTGVGKSRLPGLVAEATGGEAHTIPIRPDWTDSADVLGYEDLQGRFRPGALLAIAREATDEPDRQHVAVLDEMNLARPEHYLAEVLSRIEARRPTGRGFASPPLLNPTATDSDWRTVALPPNLALVGTVNMDESAHGFSRKVLDRAFTLELSAPDLGRWHEAGSPDEPEVWPRAAWQPRAITLGGLSDLSEAERRTVERVVATLEEANGLLTPAGYGIGYRTRDEAALFVLHATETPEAFRTREGEPVAPLDLALTMKVLPRIAGGSRSVRQALFSLLGWAIDGAPLASEDDARDVLDTWERAGRPAAISGARFPRTASRLALMTDRLLADGFASFWE